jgi:hypothetical protein
VTRRDADVRQTAAMTALPQPPNVSQNAPIAQAEYFQTH